MSVPINFNTTSFDELKTVLSKTKSHVVIAARKKVDHLSIKAFHIAAKLTPAQVQKMINAGAILYEVDTSVPIPSEDTPPTSEDPSPIPAEVEALVVGATAVSSQSGFELTPARLSFTPSGLPYVDTQGRGPVLSDRAVGDPSSRPSQEQTTTQVEGDPTAQASGKSPSESLVSQNQLFLQTEDTSVPTSPQPGAQLKALKDELARMREELEAKNSENLDFRKKLSTTEYQLATSQGETLHFQQQLGEAQQAAADSAQRVEEYQRAVQEAEEQSQQRLDRVQKEVQRYQAEAKEFEELAASVSKQNQKLDLKMSRA